jgi:hypothetical protein
MNQVFPFYREDGAPVSMTAREVLDTVNCLGYRYDDPLTIFTLAPTEGPVATPVAFTPPESTLIGETPQDQPIGLGLEPTTVDIELNAENDARLSGLVADNATPIPGAVAPQATLTLEGVRDLGAPGVTYGVYINPPAGLGADPRDPSFVGTISLFGLLAPGGQAMPGHDDQAMTGHGGQQSFNITRAVQAAQARGDWQGRVVVTFVPEGLVPLEGAVTTPAGATPGLTGMAQISWVTIDQIIVSTIE